MCKRSARTPFSDAYRFLMPNVGIHRAPQATRWNDLFDGTLSKRGPLASTRMPYGKHDKFIAAELVVHEVSDAAEV